MRDGALPWGNTRAIQCRSGLASRRTAGRLSGLHDSARRGCAVLLAGGAAALVGACGGRHASPDGDAGGRDGDSAVGSDSGPDADAARDGRLVGPDGCMGEEWYGNVHALPDGSLSCPAGVAYVAGNVEVGPTATDLDGLSCLVSVSGDLVLTGAIGLSRIDALGALESVGGLVRIAGNDLLYDLHGLEALERAGDLMVVDNPLLSSLEAFRGVVMCIDLDLAIRSNHRLRSVGAPAFERQTVVARGLVIEDNSSLEDISGFRPLRVVAGSLVLRGNESLDSLDGAFESLVAVGGDLVISRNGLQSIASFARLASLGGSLEVTDNPDLPTCEVEALRDRLVALGWDGDATIEGNDDDAPCR